GGADDEGVVGAGPYVHPQHVDVRPARGGRLGDIGEVGAEEHRQDGGGEGGVGPVVPVPSALLAPARVRALVSDLGGGGHRGLSGKRGIGGRVRRPAAAGTTPRVH